MEIHVNYMYILIFSLYCSTKTGDTTLIPILFPYTVSPNVERVGSMDNLKFYILNRRFGALVHVPLESVLFAFGRTAYRQLRARRALSLYKVNGDSALLVLSQRYENGDRNQERRRTHQFHSCLPLVWLDMVRLGWSMHESKQVEHEKSEEGEGCLFFFCTAYKCLVDAIHRLHTVCYSLLGWNMRGRHHSPISVCLSDHFTRISPYSIARRSEVGSFTCIGCDSPIHGPLRRQSNEDKAPCPRAQLQTGIWTRDLRYRSPRSSRLAATAPHGGGLRYEFNLCFNLWYAWVWLVNGEEGMQEEEPSGIQQPVLLTREIGIPDQRQYLDQKNNARRHGVNIRAPLQLLP